MKAEPQWDQNNCLMISELLRSRQIIPSPKVISQPKKVSKNKSRKALGKSSFQIEI